mmetsp:Transcript_27427/g.24306  ORF Transcript_27427/g.24306 Transcript_27427/m.24306 type:complete len:174 (+) Transcript_27427:2-523(+)
MEAFADGAADSLIDGIDFDDMIEWTEEELKIMEERMDSEKIEIESVITSLSSKIDKLHGEPGSDRLNLLKSMLKDESLILDTILGHIQDQPQNKVNLKFILAKNKLMLEYFDFTMAECNDFTSLHTPRDNSSYDKSELSHVLKLFIVFLYSNKELKPEIKKENDLEGEEVITT